MLARNSTAKFVILSLVLLAAGSGYAQDELRRTFFKEADAAKAAADALEAKDFAPKAYASGMKEYRTAEDALRRGRNIDYVRSNAADAPCIKTSSDGASGWLSTAVTKIE